MIIRQKARHSRGRRSGPRCCGGTDEIRSIVVMGQGAQDLRTPDYYLTTVSEDTKKNREPLRRNGSQLCSIFPLHLCETTETPGASALQR